jgi:hypothetical protein
MKVTEVVKTLEGSRQEPSGVGRAGCCDSRRWDRGRSHSVGGAHPTETAGISRNAKSSGTPGEKSEEAIVLWTIETTQLGEREGPLLQSSQAER